MYQLEVKALLVNAKFHAKDGWKVCVHVDPMEKAKGGSHPDGKREAAQRSLSVLEESGASIRAHPIHGRIDIVAEKPGEACYFIEVEGDSSRQREQGMYSALGQLLVAMNNPNTQYALALPDTPEWVVQATKVPQRILDLLKLEIFPVSEQGVKTKGPQLSKTV